MDAIIALEEMLKRSGMSKYALSKALGKSVNYVVNTTGRNKDISTARLAQMARVMGFRLVLVGDGVEIELGEEVDGADSDQGPAD